MNMAVEPDVLILAELDRDLLSTPAHPEQVLRVGSLPSCALRLPGAAAPVHALLKAYPHGLALLDLGHPAGTSIGDQRLAPHGRALVRSGDTVTFGTLTARLQISLGPAPRPVVGAVGQPVLQGRFRTIRKLGGGGQAQVWQALEVETGRHVALKIIKDAESKRTQRRLLREAEVLTSLDHPHIVKVQSTFTSDEGLVIVMEHVEGDSLETTLPVRGMSLLRAVRIGQHVASALEALAERNIVHRDLKPANIVIGQDGRARLIDFGVAHTEEGTRLTTPGTFVGSLCCAAPEQLIPNGTVSHQTDLYALGATLYHLLTGSPPFAPPQPTSRGLAEFISDLRTNSPTSLRTIRPDAPVSLDRLLSQLLAKTPGQRPPAARSVCNQLQQIEAELRSIAS